MGLRHCLSRIIAYFWGVPAPVPEVKPAPVFSADPRKAWLRDNVVEDYIQKKITGSGDPSVVMCVFDPDHPDLMKRFERFAQKNKIATKVIWPICYHHHFYLLIIAHEPENNQVYIGCIDGFNEQNTQSIFLEKASKLAKLLYPNAVSPRQVSESVRVQNNTVDCGVVVCYFAEHFIEKQISAFQDFLRVLPAPSSNDEPYTPYRGKIIQQKDTVCTNSAIIANSKRLKRVG